MKIERISYTFKNEQLYADAITHVSWVSENKGNSYEKLEFLGDAILDAIVSSYLYIEHNSLPEGHMAKVRAEVVSEPSLADLAKKWELEKIIKVSKGEINAVNSSGGYKDSILCDVVESIIGAIYIESGFEKTKDIILPHLVDVIDNAVKSPGSNDYKSNLQELCAKYLLPLPQYEILMEGPPHEILFTANVIVRGFDAGKGSGSSKKKAQQAAAKTALDNLTVDVLEKLAK